nr:hypothetical protein CFP56_10359 [Quercus suber]
MGRQMRLGPHAYRAECKPISLRNWPDRAFTSPKTFVRALPGHNDVRNHHAKAKRTVLKILEESCRSSTKSVVESVVPEGRFA